MIAGFAPKHRYLVVTCFDEPFSNVSEFYEKDVKTVSSSNWLKYAGEFSVNDCYLDIPPPGAAHKVTILVLPLDRGYHALVTANLEDGWSSLAYRTTKALRCRAFVLGFCTDTLQNPARYFDYIECGKSLRHVSVRKDERWEFYQHGDFIKGEDVNWFSHRFIAQRLTNQHLLSLAAAHNFVDLLSTTLLKKSGIKLVEN